MLICCSLPLNHRLLQTLHDWPEAVVCQPKAVLRTLVAWYSQVCAGQVCALPGRAYCNPSEQLLSCCAVSFNNTLAPPIPCKPAPLRRPYLQPRTCSTKQAGRSCRGPYRTGALALDQRRSIAHGASLRYVRCVNAFTLYATEQIMKHLLYAEMPEAMVGESKGLAFCLAATTHGSARCTRGCALCQ